jgi:SAM-dependent methyltransferase
MVRPEAEQDSLKQAQAEWFGSEVDPAWEIDRPYGAPAFYAWLLREKFRRSVRGLPDLRGLTALTVCGGSGMDAEFLAAAGARVIATDISLGAVSRAVERARRRGLEIEAVVADAEELPFRDRSIDVVYVHDGLHHLGNPFAALAEMARVARRGVSVTEPARAAVTGLAVRIGLAESQEESGNQVVRLRPGDIVEVLRAEGFQVTRAERYGMLYRHTPGRLSRALSAKGPMWIATRGFLVANLLAGSLGNKLTVQAVRES